jgi:hypothetical protein
LKQNLFKSKSGIRLDLGCSDHKQKGFVGLDIRKCNGVDIVWDVTKFPYPIPKDTCNLILMSHLWEHIEPKYRVTVMDELWRISRDTGQLMISCPYAGSFGASQDPTHYPCPNEATFTYFDPDYPLFRVYYPKPWKLVRNNYQMNGNLEVILEARKDSDPKKRR